MDYPRPVHEGINHWSSRHDSWLLGLMVGCGAAVVVGCLVVTSAVRGLPGDTGPVVAAIWVSTVAVLLFGAAVVVLWRRVSGRRYRVLRDTQERLRVVYGASPAGIVEIDLQQRIVDCNAAFAVMLGLREQDIRGRQGWEFFHPGSPPPDVEAVQELVAGVRASYSVVRQLRAPDGSPLTVKLDWAAIADASGAVTRLACVVTDLSEQSRTAAELVARQSFTDALLETVDVGIVSRAADGSQLSRNRAEREMLGLGVDDLAEPDATSAAVRTRMEVLTLDGAVVAPGDYPLQSALDGGGPSLQELMMGPAGGPYRQVVLRTSCITSPDGTLLGAVSALTDVTAERAVARKLAEESSRLAEAQRLGQLGSFTMEVATGGVTFSQEMYRIWGVPQGADLAALRKGMIHPVDRAVFRAFWKAALRDGGHHATSYRITRPDGHIRHLRVQLDVTLGPDGSAVQVRGTHLDVTDLEVARLEAAETSAMVSAVLAATPDFTFVTDLGTGGVVYAPPGKDIVGITSETLIEHGTGAIAALVHPEDHGILRAANVDAGDLADGEVIQLRYRLRARTAAGGG